MPVRVRPGAPHNMKKLVYIFDIDGTILQPAIRYAECIPFPKRIEKVNQLYDAGHKIVYWTARGATSDTDWYSFTKKQLDDFGCKYHEFYTRKPHYHVWVDDKAINASDFFN